MARMGTKCIFISQRDSAPRHKGTKEIDMRLKLRKSQRVTPFENRYRNPSRRSLEKKCRECPYHVNGGCGMMELPCWTRDKLNEMKV